MKSGHTKLSAATSIILLPFIIIAKRKRRMIYLLLLFTTISLSGCFQTFYKANTKSSIDVTTASELSSEGKHFIIHFANSINPLRDAQVSNDTLYGKIESLTLRQLQYVHPDTTRNKNPAKAKDKADVLMQVHLYTNAKFPLNDSIFAANVSSFYRADVYELNEKATNGNLIWSIVGITVGSLLLALLIAAAACDCGGY